jgi:trehalose 6-phosphate phosphatase
VATAVDLASQLAEDPARTALLLDVDGTLAPIVERPEDARVPDATRAELRRLHERYALVACVSGRAGADARRVVGLPELLYVGNHGLELEPESAVWGRRLLHFIAEVDWPETEDKGLSASLHYRDFADQAAAEAELEAVAERARKAGFVARFGRKVLEVLPPVRADKGTAVRRLLAQHGLDRALYAGDDTTDLDGFRALDGLELHVRVAVASAEGPAELRECADLVVASPAELFELLRRL